MSLSTLARQRCSTATTRWYATAAPKTPKASATSKKKTAATTQSAASWLKAKSKTSPNSPPSYVEEDSIAARTPFKKPSTTGLGVPSKSPSAPAKPPLLKPSSTGRPTQPVTPGAVPLTAGDAAGRAEKREAQLRTARLRRVDQEAQQAAQEEAERAYKERYKGAARRWVSGMIAMPILLVTSWYLFDRRESSACAPWWNGIGHELTGEN